MLSPFTRALAYYLGGGYALGLLCAIPFFDRPLDLDDEWVQRLRRRAIALACLGPLHPVIALTAVGLARDINTRPSNVALLTTTATTLAISLTAMVGTFAAVGG